MLHLELEFSVANNKITSTLKLVDYTLRKSYRNEDELTFGNIAPLIINGAAESSSFEKITDKTETSSKNIRFKNLAIDGNREKQRSWDAVGDNNAIAISIDNTVGLYIDNISIVNTLTDGITTQNVTNMNVTNSTFRVSGHSALFLIETKDVKIDNLTIDVRSNSGIRIFGGTHFTITNNHIFCTANSGNFGIQISNNYSDGNPLENVLIENNIIRHVPYAGIGIYTSTVNDVIKGLIIKNNIIYSSSTVAPNLSFIMGQEPNSRAQEGGGIVVQHAKEININHNTIFNNHGSGVRLDSWFYVPSGSSSDWENMRELDRMTDKIANITNNVIIGNTKSEQPRYEKVLAYGIEKRVAMYCGVNHNEECAGTTVTTANNIFALNYHGKASSNIRLNVSDNTIFSGFVNAPLFSGHDISELSYYYEEEKNPDFNLTGVSNPQVGASKMMLQRSLDLYDEYRSFFTPLLD